MQDVMFMLWSFYQRINSKLFIFPGKLKCPICMKMRYDLRVHINKLHYTRDRSEVDELMDLARTGARNATPTRKQRKDKRVKGQPRGDPKKCPFCKFRTRYLTPHIRKVHAKVLQQNEAIEVLDLRKKGP